MPPTLCHGHDAPTIEPDHLHPASHHRTHHQAGVVPLDRPRGQRSHRAALSPVIPWAMLLWVFFRQHGYGPQDVSHPIPSCSGMCHGPQSVTATRAPTTAVTGAAPALRAPASGVTPD